MKRIISAFLALLTAGMLAVPTVSVSAVEKSAGLSENKIIEIVGALEIMQGDEYGNLNLDNKVTRAEFVKMAVSASAYKDDADVKIAYSTFPDVPAVHWASGFIRTAVGAGWINGYLDGTFRPSGNVKLEEAVNIVLKLLGYTDSDFIGSYPDGQLAKYDSLKLYTGISAQRGAELTRRECMYLIYNALCTYTKTGIPYCQTIGYTPDADGNIDYSALVEDKKNGPYIVTDLSSWKKDLSAADDTIFYKDGKIITESDIALYDVLYYAPEFSTVWVYDDKTVGIVEGFMPDKNSPKSITVSGISYQLVPRDDYSGKLANGAFSVDDFVVLLTGENGLAVEAYAASEPFIAESISEIGERAENIYSNGTLTANAVIDERSLVYICEELSSAFVYDTNASGVVTALSPSKQKPESVMIGSTSYSLGNNVKKLFENESTFGTDDFVTVYIGNTGKVEYVEQADIFDTDIYEDNGLTYETLLLQTMKGPEIVAGDSWKQKLGFPAEEAKYYLDGKEVSGDVIRDYDIVYYSSTFKTVWIFSDKITGVLEKINPSTVSPTSVVVAGSEYSLETASSKLQFAGKGTFSVGDTVTLLLGYTGVVSAVDPILVSTEVLGISTAVTKMEHTGSDGKTYEDYYVTVASFDGRTHNIKTTNKDFDTGVVVIVSYSDGEVGVKQMNVKYNNVDDLKKAVKEGRISPDAVLVDYYGTSFIKTYAARLSEISITEKNVAYYSIGADGELDYLVLHDATGDGHSYGVIMKQNRNGMSSYSFYTSSQNKSISNYKIPLTGAVQIKYDGSEADKITALSVTDVTTIEGATVKYAGSSYKLWDYAECFVLEQKSYSVSDESLNDVISTSSLDYIKTLVTGDDYTIKGYYDSTGTIRVLVAQKNF